MRVKGLAALMRYTRLYELCEYEVYLTRSGVYKWRKVRATGPTKYLVSHGQNFHEVSDTPYLVYEKSEFISKQSQRVATTTFHPSNGSVSVSRVIVQDMEINRRSYKDTNGVRALGGRVHNSELTPEEVESLSAHERVQIMLTCSKEAKASRAARNAKRRQDRRALKEKNKLADKTG